MKKDLLKDRPGKLFFSYLLPALLGNIFVTIYIITDTMMIGHGVGKAGLVALNLLLPMFSVFFSFGYLFGVGGSVLMSVYRGKGDNKKANQVTSTAFFDLLAIAVMVTLICSIGLEPIAKLLGADAENMKLVKEYGVWLMGSAWIYMFSPFFQNFVRNDNAPKRCMYASIIGSLMNVGLDYVFIFPMKMGMTGAIVATILGNVINVLITSSHVFLGRKKEDFANRMKISIRDYHFGMTGKILKSGLASFFSEISNGIVIFAFNMVILKYLGNEGIVIYSVISNVAIAVNSIVTGVCAAMQPLVSFNYGAGKSKRVWSFCKIGWLTGMGIAVFLYAFIAGFPDICIRAFVSGKIPNGAQAALRIYFISIFLMVCNVYLSNFFQAIVKPKQSFLIGVLRGMILNIIFVYLLPMFFGGQAVWIVMIVVEILTFCYALYYFLQWKKKQNVAVQNPISQ